LNQMFPPKSALQTIRQIDDNQEIKQLSEEVDKLKWLNTMKRIHQSQIEGLRTVAPARVSDFPQSAPPRNDVNDRIPACVKEVINSCVKDAVANAIKAAADAGDSVQLSDRSSPEFVPADDDDAKQLFLVIANNSLLQSHANCSSGTSATDSPGIQSLVNSLARSVEPVIQHSSPGTVDIINVPVTPIDYFPPASSKIRSLKPPIPGDAADSVHLFEAMKSPIPPLSVELQFDPQNHANGAGGLFPVIPKEEDGADQSGKSSPSQLVKDEHLLPLSLSLRRNALNTEPSELNTSLHGAILQASPPSGLRRSTHTHELADSLASLPILSLSSSTTAHPKPIIPFLELTSKGVSPLAQSSGKSSGNVSDLPPPNLIKSSRKAPPPPHKTDVVRWKMNSGGSHSSGIPIGNPPGNAQSIVGVKGNPRADQPSFPSKDDVGRPTVQVLARSGNSPGNPPGNSGSADHPKTPSSSKLRSDSSKVGTNPPASLLKVPKSFGKSRFVQMLKSKSSSQKERNGIDGSNPVAHSSDNPSGSASTIPPLSQTVFLPAGRTGIGGSQGAQFQADRLVNAPPPAPSLRPELRSAATPAATRPNEKPPTLWGADIGGGEHNRVGTQFVELAFVMLKMKYSKALPDPLPTWTHPCVHCVPNLLARQACVA
jgi:hypothetical protein